ncbi:lipase family protein [Streptomyces sp. NPDC047315]|uniref:alpha/beta hydrolase family protein n=1 Tax=Streptomyces sp. NPDC047315 TaxID=3155142 RepID=UPI003410B400
MTSRVSTTQPTRPAQPRRGAHRTTATVAVTVGALALTALAGAGGASAAPAPESASVPGSGSGSVPSDGAKGRPAPGSGKLVSATELPPEARPHGGPGQVVEYTSTGANGGKVLVSGLVFAPAGTPPKGGWPVISLAHGTVGSADQCAPSRTDAARFAHDPEIRGWLDAGVAVVATDYEGLGTAGPHPYLHARSSAYGTIDIVHAARQADVGVSRKWVAMGQSQGGHAAISTAVHATRYAPGLDFRGAVATAPPTKMSRLVADRSTSPSFERKVRTALYPLVTEGLRAIDSDLDFTHLFTDRAAELVPTARTKCLPELVTQVVQSGLNDDTVWKQRPETVPALLNALRQHVDTPVVRLDRPLFIGQGGKDEIVQANVTAEYAKALRKVGSKVTYREYAAAGHGSVVDAAAADSTAWIKQRLGVR